MKNICDWNNCTAEGLYKAPKERDNSKDYRLLCLNHIKEFNKNWNYFRGMSDQQVVEFLRSDMTWHKPTQSFGSSDNFFKVLWNNVLNDGIEDKNLRDQFIKNNKINFTQILTKYSLRYNFNKKKFSILDNYNLSSNYFDYLIQRLLILKEDDYENDNKEINEEYIDILKKYNKEYNIINSKFFNKLKNK